MGEIIKNTAIPSLDTQIIRPDLNLEKWPIWQLAKSKNPPEVKNFQREITLPDKNKLIAKVEIGFTNYGGLTTEDQKVYYALIKIWEDNGRSAKQTFFSLKQLAKILKKKWGTNVIESLTNSLRRLRANPFTWINSYYDKAKNETIETLEIFNILSDLKIAKRKKNGQYIREEGYFRFNDFILNNLLAKHTKPICFDVILNFKSEIAQVLYTYIDLIMADKVSYERRTKELFNDLNIKGKTYQNLSDRKRKLNPALKELQGVKLSTGFLTEAVLSPAKEKDFKVVFVKDPYKGKKIGLADQLPAQEQLLISPPVSKRENNLVIHFHKKFSRSNQRPTNKELDQAISLIADYGEDQAKFIVDYAVKEAEKTKFPMRTFGAVFQYKIDASQLYAKQKKGQELIKINEEQKNKKEKEEKEKILHEEQELISFYQSLPLEEQEKIDQETMQKIKTLSIIGHRFREQSKEQILNSSTSKIYFESERHNILKRMKELKIYNN